MNWPAWRIAKLCSFTALGLLLAGISPASATTITFDFEELATVSSVPAVISIKSGIAATLHREDGAAALDVVDLTPFGRPVVWGSRSILVDSPWTAPDSTLIVDFSAPVTFASISFGDYDADDDGPVNMFGYGGAGGTGSVIGSDSIAYPASLDIGTNTSGMEFRTLHVSGAGIRSFTIIGSGLAPNSLYFDTLVVSPSDAAVPEPTSLLLLGTGVVGLIARRRRAGSGTLTTATR